VPGREVSLLTVLYERKEQQRTCFGTLTGFEVEEDAAVDIAGVVAVEKGEEGRLSRSGRGVVRADSLAVCGLVEEKEREGSLEMSERDVCARARRGSKVASVLVLVRSCWRVSTANGESEVKKVKKGERREEAGKQRQRRLFLTEQRRKSSSRQVRRRGTDFDFDSRTTARQTNPLVSSIFPFLQLNKQLLQLKRYDIVHDGLDASRLGDVGLDNLEACEERGKGQFRKGKRGKEATHQARRR
jgi:hypothetical protein